MYAMHSHRHVNATRLSFFHACSMFQRVWKPSKHIERSTQVAKARIANITRFSFIALVGYPAHFAFCSYIALYWLICVHQSIENSWLIFALVVNCWFYIYTYYNVNIRLVIVTKRSGWGLKENINDWFQSGWMAGKRVWTGVTKLLI